MARGKSVKLLVAIPPKYTPDFMDRLDRRTVMGKAVLDRFTRVTDDLGGLDHLSNIKRSLVRRFVWFETMIEGMECRAAAGEGVDIGAWTQLTNSWLGIARLIGIERQPRKVRSLSEVMSDTGADELPPPQDEDEPGAEQ